MTATKIQTNQINQDLVNGWTYISDSWTYASATTITVPSGAASKYSKGDKIKLTQTTVKYFYIIGVADTTLTITGGSSYTLANAAITNTYYSHCENPLGFPTEFSLGTPTWTTTGTAFTNQPTNNSHAFKIVNGWCHVRGVFCTHATSGGTGIFIATFTSGYLPTVGDGSGSAFNLSDTFGGFSYVQSGTSNAVKMAKYDGTALAGSSKWSMYFVQWLF